mgnify:CR=1 FL=1
MKKAKKIIEVSCPAKINLFLSIGNFNEKKKLHNINLINQTINLYDKITIERNNKHEGINIITNSNIPKDYTNSAYQACQKFYEYINESYDGIDIKIDKNIPNMAGLGGESTDAAGVLLGLNKWYRKLKKEELIFLASQIGSDVPYFIVDGFAHVQGCGKKVESLKEENIYKHYLIIKPNFTMNTKEMFKKLKTLNLSTTINPSDLFHNDFMYVMPDELKKLREFLLTNYKDLQHCLSGSGSSYYIASKTTILNHIKKDILANFPDYTLYSQESCNRHKIIIKIL